MGNHLEVRVGSGSPAEYGGVDWRQIRMRELGSRGLKGAEIWLIVEDENVEIRLDQDNLHIELNTVAPNLDRISVQDYRDWDWWVWFRDELPEGEFDNFYNTAAFAGKVVSTMYPQEDVVDLYEKRRLRELEDFNE